MKNPYLSVIIPVFNEEKRIKNLKRIDNYLHRQNFSSEIVIVNDGSTDDTLKKIKAFRLKTPNKVISYKKNKGKGYAIKKGMLKAVGKYRLFTDIDLSTPIEELKKFITQFKKGHEVLIGSRKSKGAKLSKRQPLLRELLGKGFTSISRIALGVNISDFTCGFKGFSNSAAEEIFKRQNIERWGFDSEILFIAHRLGFEIEEIPVRWGNNSATKVKLPQDILTSLRDLLLIRIWSLFRKYEEDQKTTSHTVIPMKWASKNTAFTLLTLLITVTLGLAAFWPSFSLALFGDDWLAFYRYKYHLGEWSKGESSFINHLFTVYGAQDISMGLLQKIFGYESLPYYIVSFVLRLAASFSIFFLTYKVTIKRLPAFFAALFFATSSIGLDATNWVFNMPSYVAIIFMSFFLYFFLESRKENKGSKLIVSGVFYYLSFVAATVRMHLLPFVALALDVLWLAIERSKKVLKKVLVRQAFMAFVFLLLRNSGYLLGSSTESIERATDGLNIIRNSIEAGNSSILLHPFVIVGRSFIPENIWPLILNYFPKPNLRHIAPFSLAVLIPLVIYYLYVESGNIKKKATILTGGLLTWTVIVKILLPVSYVPRDPAFVGPALFGGYITIVGILIALFTKRKVLKLFLLGSLAIAYLSFALPWIWVPNGLFGTPHRYFITTSYGLALFFGSLISISRTRKATIYITLASLLFVFIHANITNRYFSNLVNERGAEISKSVWGSMSYIEEVKKGNKHPFIFYFEGNSTIIYYVITFGFPPHTSLIYDIPDGSKLPIAMSWEDLLKAVTTGKNLSANYEPSPVPVENVYAFELTKEGTMNDITPQTRARLNRLLINEKAN